MDRDLEAVLTGVAAAGDVQVGAVPAEGAAGHEHQLLDAGHQALQRIHGLRALQGEQGALGHGQHLAALADPGLHVRDVAGLAGAVDDQEQLRALALARRARQRLAGAGGRVAEVDEHQVVDDGALVGQQQAVALLVHAQTHHVDGHQGFERGGGIGTDQLDLAHVRNVEQAGGFAHVPVLGDQAGGVLHRHAVTGKGHHARAEVDVQGVQGGFQKFGTRGRHGRAPRMRCSKALPNAGRRRAAEPCCPLYLRDSTRRGGRRAQVLPLRWAACLVPRPLSSRIVLASPFA